MAQAVSRAVSSIKSRANFNWGFRGKHSRGPTPLTAVQTRDLYARGQQMQEGTRDHVVNNLIVRHPRSVAIQVQMADHNEDDLNAHARRTFPDILASAHRGMSQVYFDLGRPSADLVLPTLSEHTLGQLLQLLMLATVVEGRLMGVNPYSQPGADTSRRLLREVLKTQHETTASNQGSTARP